MAKRSKKKRSRKAKQRPATAQPATVPSPKPQPGAPSAPQPPPAPISGRLPMLLVAALTLLYAGHLLLSGEPLAGSGTDIRSYIEPLHAFAHERLSQGDLPLWNPYHLGGVPFQAGVHGKLLPTTLVTLPFVPPTYDVKLQMVLHLLIGALGVVWWVRRRTRSATGAALVGAVYACSAFSATAFFAGHYGALITVAWLPWTIGLIEAWLDTRALACLLGAALTTGAMLLSGHYQMIYIGFIGAGLYLLVDRALGPARATSGQPSRPWRRSGRALVGLGAASLGGLLVGAVHVLPFLGAIDLGSRATAEGFAGTHPSSPENLATYLWPDFFGGGPAHAFTGDWNYWEGLGYIGLVPLALPLLAPFVLSWRVVLPCAIPALLGLVLSFGQATPIFDLWVDLVPGAGLFRAPGRYQLMTLLFAGLLAALTLARLEAEPLPERRRLHAVWLLPALALAGLVWMLGQDHPASGDAWKALFVLGACAAGLVFFLRKRPRLVLWGLVALTALDLLTFGRRFLTTQDTSYAWPDGLVAFLEPYREADPGLRVLDDPAMQMPNQGASVGIGQIGGYDTFVPPAYTRYLNYAAGLPLDDAGTYVKLRGRTLMIDRLGARFVLSTTPVDPRTGRGRTMLNLPGFIDRGVHGYVHVYEHPGPAPRTWLTHAYRVYDETRVYELMSNPEYRLTDAALLLADPPPEFAPEPLPAGAEPDRAAIVRYEPDLVEIEVSTASPAILVLSDTPAPGWTAEVDGRPVPLAQANGPMRAVPVPAGASLVRMRYAPAAFTLGAWVSASAVLALAGPLVLMAWRRRRRPKESGPG